MTGTMRGTLTNNFWRGNAVWPGILFTVVQVVLLSLVCVRVWGDLTMLRTVVLGPIRGPISCVIHSFTCSTFLQKLDYLYQHNTPSKFLVDKKLVTQSSPIKSEQEESGHDVQESQNTEGLYSSSCLLKLTPARSSQDKHTL